jgi:hypothetical protein
MPSNIPRYPLDDDRVPESRTEWAHEHRYPDQPSLDCRHSTRMCRHKRFSSIPLPSSATAQEDASRCLAIEPTTGLTPWTHLSNVVFRGQPVISPTAFFLARRSVITPKGVSIPVDPKARLDPVPVSGTNLPYRVHQWWVLAPGRSQRVSNVASGSVSAFVHLPRAA